MSINVKREDLCRILVVILYTQKFFFNIEDCIKLKLENYLQRKNIHPRMRIADISLGEGSA